MDKGLLTEGKEVAVALVGELTKLKNEPDMATLRRSAREILDLAISLANKISVYINQVESKEAHSTSFIGTLERHCKELKSSKSILINLVPAGQRRQKTEELIENVILLADAIIIDGEEAFRYSTRR